MDGIVAKHVDVGLGVRIPGANRGRAYIGWVRREQEGLLADDFMAMVN